MLKVVLMVFALVFSDGSNQMLVSQMKDMDACHKTQSEVIMQLNENHEALGLASASWNCVEVDIDTAKGSI